MEEITRFRVDMDGSMEPYEHGQWVRFEDVQQRTWVGLTCEDYNEIFEKARSGEHAVQLAEAKLKEKNT